MKMFQHKLSWTTKKRPCMAGAREEYNQKLKSVIWSGNIKLQKNININIKGNSLA